MYFTGNCQEAMEFYKGIFGGELDITPNEDGKTVMHAALHGGDIELMASDGTRTTPYEPSFISLTIGGDDEKRLTEIFSQLAEGGEVTSDLKTESWGDTFGSLTDKFGVDWQVVIEPKQD